jgi:polyisoprenoid-binding protein YceI
MTFRHLKTVTLAAVLAAAPALVAAQGAPATLPAVVQAGNYGIEPVHTRILFAVSHMGFSTWYGEFSGASGTLALDPARIGSSQVDITVPAASLNSSNATLDAELKGDKWFDVARFDTIRFHSTHVARTGENTADIAGDLTLHGVTRPVTLKAKFNAAGANPLSKAYTVGFEVAGDIKRSNFGVATYVPLIGDDVHLMISAAFEKKPA